ncbi:DNA-binding transcription factor yap1 [Sparganum proliferum]
MDYAKTYQTRVRSDHGSQLIRNIPRNTDDPFTLTSPICELPSEYQMAINDENQVYFLNHKTKETTWFDPRIPHEEQKWGMTMKELNDLHISYALRQKRGKHSLENPSGENQFSSPANDRVCPSITAMNTPISTCQSLEGSNCSPLPNSSSIINSCVRPSSVPRIQNLNTAGGAACRPAAGAKTMQTQQMNLLSPQNNQLSVHSRIIHAKSASQPVPMPVSGVGGHADACTGDYLGMGGCGLGIAPSSSMSGLLDQYTHLTPGALTSSSSGGHLVQDLEDLSLTASCTGDLHSQSLPAQPPPPPPPPHHHLHSESICGPPDDAHLPHLPQTHPQQQPQQQQQQQQMFRGASNVLVMNDLAQGSCLSIVAGQHSHQSSMDSGVGQSVVGHSSCGSSQTPEHVKISRYDPSIDNFDMDPELLEGLNYPSDWCHSMNYYMPHQVPSTMATNMEPARTQQG